MKSVWTLSKGSQLPTAQVAQKNFFFDDFPNPHSGLVILLCPPCHCGA
ncbi:MAG: hypothetical protein HXK16_01290 [Alloprevotella sp.]|nr:hypothetical protein [Alloprevotella sp.]